MFTSLFSIHNKIQNASASVWLNTWFYSNMSSWVFLSTELLSYYITINSNLRTVVTTTLSLTPSILYLVTTSFICLVQLALLLS